MTSEKIDRIFKAFADKTRLRILYLLTCRKELCVCELIEILKMKQPKISRHLAYLRNAKLVQDRKDGLWCHYSLTHPKNRFQKRLIECLKQCFNEVGILRRDKEILRKIRKEKKKIR